MDRGSARGVNNVRSDVNRIIWRLFKENGITVPIAQREVLFEMKSAVNGGRRTADGEPEARDN